MSFERNERTLDRVSQYSGGVGSWAATRRIIDLYGPDDVTMMFSDTLIEDEDLYRFLLETWQQLSGVDLSAELRLATNLPPVEDGQMEERRSLLYALSDRVNARVPMVRWIIEGRTPWEVFESEKYVGNTRVDPCSRLLKRELLWRYMVENFDPADTVVYFGIDWTEEHRLDNVRKHRPEWDVQAPLTEPPLLAKSAFIEALAREGIAPPRLYGLGFPHNNCGGFCVKAGQAHFVHLLTTLPARYAYHEAEEARVGGALGATVLRDRTKAARAQAVGLGEGDLEPLYIGGAKVSGRYIDPRSGEEVPRAVPLSLRELRERVESGDLAGYDPDDWGACGCALDG